MVAIQLRSGLSDFESRNVLCCLKRNAILKANQLFFFFNAGMGMTMSNSGDMPIIGLRESYPEFLF
jgi:hypothetical protein